jgi:hypothetical protein
MPPLARLVFLTQLRKPELTRIDAAFVVASESGHDASARNAEDLQHSGQEI